MKELKETLKIMALGLDYRKYLRYEAITSREIVKGVDGSYKVRRLTRELEGDLTTTDIQFCVDFVIECAIILKESDFEFKPIDRVNICRFLRSVRRSIESNQCIS